MSRLGVWQLRKLVLNYCEFSGSSRGVRCEGVGVVFCRGVRTVQWSGEHQ